MSPFKAGRFGGGSCVNGRRALAVGGGQTGSGQSSEENDVVHGALSKEVVRTLESEYLDAFFLKGRREERTRTSLESKREKVASSSR